MFPAASYVCAQMLEASLGDPLGVQALVTQRPVVSLGCCFWSRQVSRGSAPEYQAEEGGFLTTGTTSKVLSSFFLNSFVEV